MKVKFREEKSTFGVKFGNVTTISDGGFEKGYEQGLVEGKEQGIEIGYNNGYEVGNQEGYDKGYGQGYDSGYGIGYEEANENAITSSPFYLVRTLQSTFQSVIFPENYEMVLRIKRPCSTTDMFGSCTNIKSVKLIADEIQDTDKVTVPRMFQYNKSIETVDLTQWCRKFDGGMSSFMESTFIKRIIGALDFSLVTGTYAAFSNAGHLEEIEFVPNTIKVELKIQSTKLNKVSITSIVNGLDNEITGQTLSLSKTAKEREFTDEEWATLIAPKTNWTISLS